YRACEPLPSLSRKCSATSAWNKSGVALGGSRSASCSSVPVIDLDPSSVKSPSSSAESRTLAGQHARPTYIMRAGDAVGVEIVTSILLASGIGAHLSV